MKILITGGSGLLGQYLNLSLSKENEILTIYNSKSGNCSSFIYMQCDINNHKLLTKIFNEFNPSIVIHTAAFTTPQINSSFSEALIKETNINSTRFIAELCERHKSKLFYTSTDLVYDGNNGPMIKEDAKISPASLYAESKLQGELKIKETFNNYIILRTSLLYGFGLMHSKCHFDKMYSDLKEHRNVKLFVDQYRTPLSLKEAANIISELCKLNISGETINFGGTERVSRYDLGKILCEIAELDQSLLEKISMKEIPNYPQVADVSMNTDKLQSYNIKVKSIKESLVDILNTNNF